MATRGAAVRPPFAALDPGLRLAEHFLAGGQPGLCRVLWALPDESAAADRLNELMVELGAQPCLDGCPGSWRLVYVGRGRLVTPVTAAVCAVAELVALSGWGRFKRCARCGRPVVDRTNGCSRRWCDEHRRRGVGCSA
ncbi:MAG: hypothetical protein GEV07_07385 [Streptosporangiales bacterium]|nr:hypothetical protein [Streptosporangiales bacterium]